MANPAPNSGKRTAEQRAAYRRKTGKVTVEYVPQAVTLALAAEKRAARHDAHVRAWRAAVALRRHWNNRRAHAESLHDSHVRVFRNGAYNWRARYKTDPEFALKERLRTQARKKAKLHPKLDDLMRDAINRNGNSMTVADVCGYTIKELRVHIERQFKGGMDWNAFMRGDIHIDHIRPQRLFDLSNIDGVRACWSLSNLRPLWAVDNLTKGGKADAPL
ncbi:hypothetical protein [Burkholderia pseudomallei]|uniref:hypothetical protein n=1 Tax=Burkholderia pseudomallei TaxID=28450 RepID=UPI00100C1A2B|nr:hypothetical protein [Burkholderia pseudomallei]